MYTILDHQSASLSIDQLKYYIPSPTIYLILRGTFDKIRRLSN